MTAIRRSPTYQDLTWFLDLYRKNQLDLDPPYQRRSVWTKPDRLYFLDTVFHGFPSPAIFLNKTLSEDGVPTYHVVDGKQRLESVFQFVDDKFRLADNVGDDRLNGKKWSELGTELKRLLWDYSIPVEYVDTTDTSLVNAVFDLLNRNVRKLNAQELRHARYSGWFATYVEDEVAKPEWRTIGLVTTARERRMADAQFLAEMLLVVLSQEVLGFDQSSLDHAYAALDTLDQESEPEQRFSRLTIDEFLEAFAVAKSYLLSLVKASPGVVACLKTVTNMYSLWSVIALHHGELDDSPVTAEKYIEFMRHVAEYQEDPEHQPTGAIDALAQAYWTNSRGASTDLAQRRARHDALLAALGGGA